MGYGGCKPRLKSIDKCKLMFCLILRIIKIRKKGECMFMGLDLTKKRLKMEK